MSNTKMGEVSIRLDRTRVMKFSFRALEAIEEALGVAIDELEETKAGRTRQLKVLLWASLLHEDRNLRLEDVTEMIEQAEGETPGEQLDYLSGKIREAMVAAGFEKEKKPPAGSP